MKIDVQVQLVPPEALTRIEVSLATLTRKVTTIMATLDELVGAVAGVATAVAPLGAAIDALEAAVSAAGGISAADQAKIDAAFASLQSIATAVNAAVADAGDGVDEGASAGPV